METSTLRYTVYAGATAAVLAFFAHPALAANAAPAAGGSVLRVCADPNYMPYSNREGQGFENKVAALVAHAMGRKLDYVWASYRGHGGFSNFLAENLDAHKCDVVMNLPFGDNEDGYTAPYYKSSYVFITRKSNDYSIRSMNAEVLHTIKIGFEASTTPETAIKMLGLINNAVSFHVAGNPNESPKLLLQAVQDGKVGVMITWAPAIGYFLKDFPDLKVSAVPAEEYGPGLPQVSYTYSMSMGVRRHDTALKAALDKVIAAEKPQIASILAGYDIQPYAPIHHVNFSNQ